MEKSDIQLQHDVIAELGWEPRVDPADIGVAVNEGVVTLSGYVKTYPEKLAAEAAAQRVAGVKAIAEDIKLHLASEPKTADHEIAKRIVDVFGWDVSIPANDIDVKVEHGWVTLTGAVDRPHQAAEAAVAAGRIAGVVGVTNRVAIRPGQVVTDLRNRILTAFERQADIDAASIGVEVDGSVVKLTGRVKAWTERNAAARVVFGGTWRNKRRERYRSGSLV